MDTTSIVKSYTELNLEIISWKQTQDYDTRNRIEAN